MLIDSIEAGARTVDPPTREKFLEMVQRVIFVKMHQGQLDESGLSIEDIRMLAMHITDALVNAYHKRIRYPWQDAHDRGEAPLPVPAGADARSPPPPALPETPAQETGRFHALREEGGDVSDTGKFRRQAAHDAAVDRAHDESKE
jgi:cyclic-di-AMP phosphodiesterase PgpH